MADRIPVTSLMRSSITGADRTGQHRDVSPQGVAGCRAPSINTSIHLSLLVDKAERCALRCDRPLGARQFAQPAPVRHAEGTSALGVALSGVTDRGGAARQRVASPAGAGCMSAAA